MLKFAFKDMMTVLGRSRHCWVKSLTRHISNGNSLPVLTLYTKENCQLCDEALEVLQPYKHRMMTVLGRSRHCWVKSLTRHISNGNSLPVLTLYTKENCQLCDEALEVLQPYKHRFQLEEVDIKNKENNNWFNKYRYDIPVFHFNGQYLMKHRVDVSLLEETLKLYENTIDTS